LQQQLEAELQETLNLTENIAIHEREQSERYKQLKDAAAGLSARRQQVIPDIEKRINKLLQLVGMPNARFQVQIKQSSQPGTHGIDDITLMLDANKSGQFLPVHKAASGGEMSRIMLCIKSLIAKAMELPTLIFDEVDAGISGEAARQVGALLQELGRHHQLICITHQPQVAARGDRHFFVYKDADKNKRITTRMRVLQKDERVLAIAQMIGGETPSEAALQNARELVAV
jgi:DNA repair protein RecN (Recombination protein N)